MGFLSSLFKKDTRNNERRKSAEEELRSKYQYALSKANEAMERRNEANQKLSLLEEQMSKGEISAAQYNSDKNILLQQRSVFQADMQKYQKQMTDYCD